MRKIITLIVAIIMVMQTLTVYCFAESTTTLTTTVPASTYIINIPASQEIPFGTTEIDIGNITVTDSTGFAEGKNLKVTVTYDEFKADGVSTTIPFNLYKTAPSAYGTSKEHIASGDSLTFLGTDNGSVNKNVIMSVTGNMQNYDEEMSGILLFINNKNWGKALAGEYTATITFTCEVVVK